MQRVFFFSSYLVYLNNTYISQLSEYFFQNIFRISMSFKQIFFSLFNLDFSFVKLFSTGVFLKKQIKSFKFFKKSNFNISPLVMILRFTFVDFFKKVYIIECLNYNKKQYIFLKKFLSSVKMELKFMLFKKTWIYTTKPIKRIKRRVTKMLQNL